MVDKTKESLEAQIKHFRNCPGEQIGGARTESYDHVADDGSKFRIARCCECGAHLVLRPDGSMHYE
jgi:hypothetical protein